MTTKDLPPIMTALTDKPLPPIRDERSTSPPLVRSTSRPLEKRAATLPLTPTSSAPERSHTDKPRKQTSKMSLFSMFSRPKVEKLRGYAEPGLAPSPLDSSASRSVSPEAREPKKFIPTRPATAMSVRSSAPPTPPLNDRNSPMEEIPRSRRKRRASWTPPPLCQAYSQSVKAAKAQTVGESAPPLLSRRRRDSLDATAHPEKAQRNPSISSFQRVGLTKKIFALTKTGQLLQYADKGATDRLPEKVLQLIGHSVACACNLVPGEPFVLQVAHDVESKEARPSSVSLLSRMGLRGSLARKETPCLVLVLQTQQELDEWVMAVKKQISRLGGSASQASGETLGQPAEGRTAVDNKVRRSSLLRFRQDTVPSPLEKDIEIDTEESISNTKTLSNVIEEPAGSVPPSPRSETLESVAPSHDMSSAKAGISPNRKPKTPRHLPLSDIINDATSTSDQVSKAASFGVKSTAPAVIKQQLKPTDVAGETPGGAAISDTSKKLPVISQESPRPLSVVTELPVIDNPRVRARTSSLPTSASVEAKQNDPKLRRFLTSEPSDTRQATTKALALPLNINTGTTATKSPDRESSTDLSPVIKSTDRPSSSASSNCHSRQTSGARLSLFPSPNPSYQAPAAQARPTTPAKDSRSLRRPSNIQVRPNHAPFLSSVRDNGQTRPPLNKAGSNPSLRTTSSSTPSAVKPTFSKRAASLEVNMNTTASSVASDGDVQFGIRDTSRAAPSPTESSKRPTGLSNQDESEELTALPTPPRSSNREKRPLIADAITPVSPPRSRHQSPSRALSPVSRPQSRCQSTGRASSPMARTTSRCRSLARSPSPALRVLNLTPPTPPPNRQLPTPPGAPAGLPKSGLSVTATH